MTDEEKAIRLTALTEMFSGFGSPVTDERLKWYGNLTKDLPLDLLRPAIRRASLEAGAFPPGPGDILRAGCALDMQPNEGQLPSPPRWYQVAMGTAKRREQPKQVGPRTAKVDRLAQVFE